MSSPACPQWRRFLLKVAKVEIEHVGPQSVSDELIRANIRVKPGDPYLRAAIDEDIRTLYATASVLRHPRPDHQRAGRHRSDLRAAGQSAIGRDQISREQKIPAIPSCSKKSPPKPASRSTNENFSPTARRSRRCTRRPVIPARRVRIPLAIEQSTGRATATFEITESPKVKITRIEFVDATAFSQKTLRKQIKTRRHWMFSWMTGGGVFKDEQFDDDKEKLVAILPQQRLHRFRYQGCPVRASHSPHVGDPHYCLRRPAVQSRLGEIHRQ